ncbi:MAG TPA: hypothetical protein VNJ47_07520 [Nevskiales bacterium]|nr:hypothetical protein [Nevskiales bacterium]
MNTPLVSALIYLLGFIGLASIGLIPLRSWQVLRDMFRSNPRQVQRTVLGVLAVLITMGALFSDAQITARIFKCLTETYCGPGVASGWTYLAMLGVVHLVFEAVIFVIQQKSGHHNG